MNAYLEEILKNKQQAADKTYEAAQVNASRAKDSAYTNQLDANRAAANSYMQTINPYGVNAEKRFSSGLTDSGYKNKTLTGTYNSYQKTLGDNTRSYLSSLGAADNDLLSADYQRSAAGYDAQSDYAQNAYDEYYRLLELQRQKERDAVKDSQWQKEYNLKYGA